MLKIARIVIISSFCIEFCFCQLVSILVAKSYFNLHFFLQKIDFLSGITKNVFKTVFSTSSEALDSPDFPKSKHVYGVAPQYLSALKWVVDPRLMGLNSAKLRDSNKVLHKS